MVNLINFLNFAKQYFYTSTEDEELFRECLDYMYYSNGVVGLDFEHSPSYYYRNTKYLKGSLTFDISIDMLITYVNGGLDADESIMRYEGGGRLWMVD